MIKVLSCGEYQTNCYLYEKDKKLIVIDPGDDANLILEEIKKTGLNPSAIILTHGHFDHIFSVDILAKKFKIDVYIHPEDIHYFTLPNFNMSAYYYKKLILKTKPIPILDNNFNIDGIDIQVIETPGHTQGGVCFFIDGNLFSGDTIFFETIGRTDIPNGKHSLLLKSVNRVLNILDDDTVIYPGHGKPTTVKYEKKNNPFYQR